MNYSVLMLLVDFNIYSSFHFNISKIILYQTIKLYACSGAPEINLKLCQLECSHGVKFNYYINNLYKKSTTIPFDYDIDKVCYIEFDYEIKMSLRAFIEIEKKVHICKH